MKTGYPQALERLIRELSRLPTIGRRSAQRLAFHLLKSPPSDARQLADAIAALHSGVRFCSQCFYLTESGLCAVCSDPSRDQRVICVVEEPQDAAALEKSGSYSGLYHVLLGRLSPLQGVTPEDLRIKELMARLETQPRIVNEVILATNPNVDGDATALYLHRLIEPLGLRVTRLGLGLSTGSSLDSSDELTLQRAFEGRRSL
ncbi:MAG: recombination mediator RecR [Candidatus Sumerlaeaceae bacterium]|nr:recombination mediator RecR [Candidatus Sumerlaeaceae bacterium]